MSQTLRRTRSRWSRGLWQVPLWTLPRNHPRQRRRGSLEMESRRAGWRERKRRTCPASLHQLRRNLKRVRAHSLTHAVTHSPRSTDRVKEQGEGKLVGCLKHLSSVRYSEFVKNWILIEYPEGMCLEVLYLFNIIADFQYWRLYVSKYFLTLFSPQPSLVFLTCLFVCLLICVWGNNELVCTLSGLKTACKVQVKNGYRK